MHRIAIVALALCAFVLFGLAGSAQAGYYGNYAGFAPYGWIPSDCCTAPVVPLTPTVLAAPGAPAVFAPVVPAAPVGRPLRLVEQLPDCAYCDSPPARFSTNPYWPPDCLFGGCPVYVAAVALPGPGLCRPQRVRVVNRHGRSVWRVKTICR
ncbi:MAG TPA: hypothetical protein VG986_08635 [Pseudolabrys sp.]|nr:hypothetical protein [Pseudolabrys sp.]